MWGPGAGQPGLFPRASTMIYIFTSEYSNRVITITRAAASVAAAQEIIPSPDWEYLCVVVNNFPSLCSRFVHLWPGQRARDKQMCRRDASPSACWLLFGNRCDGPVLFLWCLGVRWPRPSVTEDNQRGFIQIEIGVQRPVNWGWG